MHKKVNNVSSDKHRVNNDNVRTSKDKVERYVNTSEVIRSVLRIERHEKEGRTRYSNTRVRDLSVWMISWSVTMLLCLRSRSRETKIKQNNVSFSQ